MKRYCARKNLNHPPDNQNRMTASAEMKEILRSRQLNDTTHHINMIHNELKTIHTHARTRRNPKQRDV